MTFVPSVLRSAGDAGSFASRRVVKCRTQRGFAASDTCLISLAALAAVAAVGCARSEAETKAPAEVAAAAAAAQKEAAPVPVTLVQVRQVSVPRVLTLSGSLIGAEQAQVAAGAAGKVLATYVERGSVVRKGATLAKLDSRALSAQIEELTAQIESLRAQQGQANLDCDRMQQMFAKGAIAKADFERSGTQCATAKWSLAGAEARRNQLNEALRDTDIRAPFSGLVVERAVSPGEWVRVDSRVVSMVSTDALRVELTVPEAEVAGLKPGQPIELRVPAAGNTTTYRGKLKFIGPSVRQQSRDAVVEAVLDHQAPELRPGMFVTAQIALGEQALPAVPHTAIRSDGLQRHLFVEVGGRLEDRLVQVGAPRGGDLPILNGVKLGERVADPAGPALHDGVRVN
jgi:membrane fusion protein (multidrug efflux system)